MAKEYSGLITSISLPCTVQLEVRHSVITEEHYLGNVKRKWEHESGEEFHLRVDVFEKYVGDGEHLGVPVIKYSTEDYAPASCGSLRLRPVNYYRALATEARGVGDAMEGCRSPHEMGLGSEMTITNEKDGTSIRLDASGANMTDACRKTFMHCCSLYDSNQVLTQKRASDIFEQDYTHGSVLRSSKELAEHIGVSFAATMSDMLMESGKVPNGCSATYIWIIHGPVNYLADPPPMLHSIESFFTKPDEEIYRNQNEYRFWLGMLDGQAQSDDATIDLPVPPEFVTGVELDSARP